MSAPNSSQMYNPLQNRRDHGDLADHPPPRPLRRLRRVDLSLHHDPNQGCGKVFRGTKTRLHRPKCSTSRTPTSSALFVRFCHRAADLGRVMPPPPQAPFCHRRPNWRLSSKCSPIYSDREPIFACFSFAWPHLMHHQQNSNSCTPPGLRRWPRFSKTSEGGPPAYPRLGGSGRVSAKLALTHGDCCRTGGFRDALADP